MTACLVRSHCRVAGSRMVLCWAFSPPCSLLPPHPPLIPQPAPRARLCSPIYKFCAHVAEWSGVYCRGTLAVMRPHVSEPFFLRFTPTLETRIWPCLHPLRKSDPRAPHEVYPPFYMEKVRRGIKLVWGCGQMFLLRGGGGTWTPTGRCYIASLFSPPFRVALLC